MGVSRITSYGACGAPPIIGIIIDPVSPIRSRGLFGLLYARQSCANQPPGSDAVAVSLALARPTTEWHQHIQNRRSDPCIAAQISRGPTVMGRPPLPCGCRRCPVCVRACKARVFLWGCVGLGGECFGYAKAPWGVCSEGLPVRVVRRRATLPHPVGCSTIAVPGLSYRVRNGTGRLTRAMTTAKLRLITATTPNGVMPACGGLGTG